MSSITRVKKSKDELFNVIKDVFDEIRHERKLMNDVSNLLIEYKVKIGTLNEVMIDENKLRDLDPSVLCLLTMALYQVVQKEKINPDNFYNPPEINMAKRYTGVNIAEQIEFPIVIENVIRVGSNNDFITSMTIQEIVHWNNSKLLNYNYETQRTAKQNVRRSGAIILRPDVKLSSVKKIKEFIVKGKFKPDTLTYNILLDGNDDIVYDDKNKRLVINSCTQIDILDGFHRILGMTEALEENPDIELSMNVAIKNYDIDSAKFYFGQINTTNPVGRARTEELLNERFADMIVNELKSRSELSGKVSSKKSISGKVGELTSFSVLADAIHEVFAPESKKDYLDITKYLSTFFDYLIDSFPTEFKRDVLKTRETTWINHPNIFVGYVVLAKRMQDKGVDVTSIDDIVKRIDFNKETSPLNEILQKSQGKDNSKKVRKAIADYFQSVEI